MSFISELKSVKSYTPFDKENRKVLFIIVIACLCLIGIQYLSNTSSYLYFLPLIKKVMYNAKNILQYYLYSHPDYELHQLVWWGGWTSFFYFIIPTLFIKVYLRENLSDYGFKFRGMFKGWQIYLTMLAIILPCVFIVSFESGFQSTYPFYSPPKENFWGKLLIWELTYMLQFITLEFFFRGFIVHGLKHKLGFYSVLVMIMPYCMIHFTKPLPECIGSIIAGLILGTLSYRYTSVMFGAILHMTVAICMDLLSLWHKGYFI